MKLTVLDENFQETSILDIYDSIIWTDRYSKCGDFEIYTGPDMRIKNALKIGYYLRNRDSEYVMAIETHEISSEKQKKNLIIGGRSLESILDYRVIWTQTILTGNFQNGVKQLLDENAINPSDPDRKISQLYFEPSTDPIIMALTIDTQFTGDSLYDAISNLCLSQNIGFKITLMDDFRLRFKLYVGVDRSYNQLINPYVVFSPKFENIIKSNSIESNKTNKTITLVGGEGDGIYRRLEPVPCPTGALTGLARRETFTDARDISSSVEGRTLTLAEYVSQMQQKGLEDLAKKTTTKSFEGEVDTTQTYKYGESFFMGDIVQLRTEYGLEATERVTEMVMSESTTGLTSHPTFTKI